MRIDLISIFPDYFEPLSLSLVGKAIADGVVEVHCHDLRAFATDRHRTVDDAPFGGGPGMVMLAPVWGSAIDAVIAEGAAGVSPRLVVPTPSGVRFDQAVALEYSHVPWLIFACGRYEGIDARVASYYCGRMQVDEMSIGDFVLAGGEVAALAMTEAVVRLIPGVLGNAESARHDSFGADLDGELEGPQYTRPSEWRGMKVPEVLMSGDHGRIAEWRRDSSRLRTRTTRPDLSGPAG